MNSRIRKRARTVCLVFAVFLGAGTAHNMFAQDGDVAGTFFGEPVSRGNYNFILRTVLTYNTAWGAVPGNREDLEKRIWDDLLLSYEAHQRDITVSQEELEEKITEALKRNNVVFNWKENPEQYKRWVKENLGVSIEAFTNQMMHLAQLKKLYMEVKDNISPSITEQEALQEYRNERNSLSVELAEFKDVKMAEAFYEEASRNPKYWDRQKEKDRSRDREERMFRQPGFVALEFLMQMWKFPKKAVYEMMEMEKGSIYPPVPIYKGYGVFKILDIGRADESQFPKFKEKYVQQLNSTKKIQGFKDWVEHLRKDADIQIFVEVPPEITF